MSKNLIKKWLKTNANTKDILACIISFYLKLVYKTIKWHWILPSGYSRQEFDKETKAVFAMWHNRLAIAPYAFKQHKEIYTLVSPHSDGQIISSTLLKFDYKIIEGSTNKGSLAALHQIIKHLAAGHNIAITPDGPRGPKYKINSNIVGIAKIAGARIIPISFYATNFFTLRSWDELIVPLPFGSAFVRVGEPLELLDNQDLANKILEEKLNELSAD